MSRQGIIGIVGGVGPAAGFDLAMKIAGETKAATDQEHLPVIVASLPGEIADRTEFLLGASTENPGYAVADIIERFLSSCCVVGIPCNTMHAEPVFTVIRNGCERIPGLKLLNMVEEVVRHIKEDFPDAERVGVLATKGTAFSRVYQGALEKQGLKAVMPDSRLQEEIHEAIYSRVFGIKSTAPRISPKAGGIVAKALRELSKRSDVAVLACTELPLALRDSDFPVVDSTRVLARALIRAASPSKLRPL